MDLSFFDPSTLRTIPNLQPVTQPIEAWSFHILAFARPESPIMGRTSEGRLPFANVTSLRIHSMALRLHPAILPQESSEASKYCISRVNSQPYPSYLCTHGTATCVSCNEDSAHQGWSEPRCPSYSYRDVTGMFSLHGAEGVVRPVPNPHRSPETAL